MTYYRKKPVVIEAIEYIGNFDHDLAAWCGGRVVGIGQGFAKIEIDTLEGVITASPGDFIIKGVQGEFYPCKPGIFIETYEEVAT
jgi:hypothetical protein